jgi:hypothetical protein
MPLWDLHAVSDVFRLLIGRLQVEHVPQDTSCQRVAMVRDATDARFLVDGLFETTY